MVNYLLTTSTDLLLAFNEALQIALPCTQFKPRVCITGRHIFI